MAAPHFGHPLDPPYGVRILALDLASTITGWCELTVPDPMIDANRYARAGSWILDAPGHKATELATRLTRLYSKLHAALTDYHPTHVVVERPDYARHNYPDMRGTVYALGAAYGVVLAALAAEAIPHTWFTANDWHDQFVGLATANKEDVRITLARRGYTPPRRPGSGTWDYDAADAMGLALVTADTLMIPSRAVRQQQGGLHAGR